MPFRFDGIYLGSPRADRFDLVAVMRSSAGVEPFPSVKLYRALVRLGAMPGNGWGEPYPDGSARWKGAARRFLADEAAAAQAPAFTEEDDHYVEESEVTRRQKEFIKARDALTQAVADVRAYRRSILDFAFWGTKDDADNLYRTSYHDQTVHLIEEVLTSSHYRLTKEGLRKIDGRLRRYGITQRYFRAVAHDLFAVCRNKDYYRIVKRSLALTFAQETEPRVKHDVVERMAFRCADWALRAAFAIGLRP